MLFPTLRGACLMKPPQCCLFRPCVKAHNMFCTSGGRGLFHGVAVLECVRLIVCTHFGLSSHSGASLCQRSALGSMAAAVACMIKELPSCCSIIAKLLTCGYLITGTVSVHGEYAGGALLARRLSRPTAWLVAAATRVNE